MARGAAEVNSRAHHGMPPTASRKPAAAVSRRAPITSRRRFPATEPSAGEPVILSRSVSRLKPIASSPRITATSRSCRSSLPAKPVPRLAGGALGGAADAAAAPQIWAPRGSGATPRRAMGQSEPLPTAAIQARGSRTGVAPSR